MFKTNAHPIQVYYIIYTPVCTLQIIGQDGVWEMIYIVTYFIKCEENDGSGIKITREHPLIAHLDNSAQD